MPPTGELIAGQRKTIAIFYLTPTPLRALSISISLNVALSEVIPVSGTVWRLG
jgi:hypothetical protein